MFFASAALAKGQDDVAAARWEGEVERMTALELGAVEEEGVRVGFESGGNESDFWGNLERSMPPIDDRSKCIRHYVWM